MENRRKFGKWLQEQRLTAGYSQVQVAKILDFNTRGNVVGYENGNAPVPLERIFDFAETYGIDIEDILDKLAEYEPNLYRRFCDLEDRYFGHFLNKFKGTSRNGYRIPESAHPGLHKQNYQDTGGYRRKGFLNEDGYIEVDQNIYYQTLIDLIEKALQDGPPQIIFPGITNFVKFGPQIVTGPNNYAHQVPFKTPVLKRNNPCSIIWPVKTVQIHQGGAYNYDGDKGHEGILHRENQYNGITRPAPRYLLPDYQGPGKELHTNPIDLDQGPDKTNGTIQGNLGEKPWTVLISKYFLRILIIIFFFSATANAEPRPWTNDDKALLTWGALGALADIYTTTQFLNNPNNWETNRVIGRHPDALAVVSYIAAEYLISVTIGYFLPVIDVPIFGKIDLRQQLLYNRASRYTSNSCWNTRLDWR